jgi:hypothetical protein
VTEERQQPTGPRPRSASTRFEATVHAGDQEQTLEGVADLDLDRVPDPAGGVRLIVTADEAAELVERGYEVHLLRALPVQPLDDALITEDDDVRAWLEDQVRGIDRREGS